MKNLSVDTVLPLMRSACMLNFWLYDHMAWFAGGAKVLAVSPAQVSVTQARFWLAAVLCSLTLDTRAILKHVEDIKAAGPEKAEESLFLQYTSLLCFCVDSFFFVCVFVLNNSGEEDEDSGTS